MPKQFLSEEVKQKAKQTRENNIKQLATLEEQETHLLIDYYSRKLKIYTSKATVMNRLERLGYPYAKQETIDGQIWSRSYEFGIEDIGKFLRTTIFKYD